MNTFILLIIIGAISALFRKSKTSNSETKAKPIFKEIRSMLDSQMPQMAQQKPGQYPFQRKIETVEKKYKEIENETEFVPVTVAAVENVPAVPPPGPTIDSLASAAPQHSAEQLIPEADTLINAIIWSEVLGAPRAKKPYAARKR